MNAWLETRGAACYLAARELGHKSPEVGRAWGRRECALTQGTGGDDRAPLCLERGLEACLAPPRSSTSTGGERAIGASEFRSLRALAPDLPVLFATGREDLARTLAPDAPLLPKPFDDEDLLAAVAEALGAGA